MPKFNNREEYERWKREKYESNLRREQVGHVQERPRKEGSGFEEADSTPPLARTDELRSISDLFSASWEIYKSRFWTLVPLYIFSVFFLLVFIGIFAGAGFLSSLFIPERRILMVSLGALIGTLPGVAAMCWVLTAFAFAVTDESLGMRDALKKGWGRVWSFFWLVNIASFLIMGGYLLLIIPGVVFTVWFAFSQFILVTGDERGMDALLKSKEYVRDRWFDIFLRLIVVWLVAGCVGMVPLAGPIVSMLFFPFVMVYVYLIYGDLREIKGEIDYPHSSGEKVKWIAAGSLGYVMMPLLLLGILGTTLTIPFFMLLRSMMAAR